MEVSCSEGEEEPDERHSQEELIVELIQEHRQEELIVELIEEHSQEKLTVERGNVKAESVDKSFPGGEGQNCVDLKTN